MESLILLDRAEVGSPILDPVLKEIAEEPARRNAQYWIERLASRAESVIDLSLDRLVDLNILQHHDGEFWTLSQNIAWRGTGAANGEGTAVGVCRIPHNERHLQ